jgi:hypothetical protein
MRTTEDRASGELREGYAEIGDVRLHYAEAGGAAGGVAARVPGVLVWVAGADRAAGGGGVPRGRARHARLQPVLQAGRRPRLRHPPAGRRHGRPDPRARRRVRDAGRARLGPVGRLGHRDGLPRGGGPAGHLELGAPAQAVGGTAPPRAAPQVLVLFSSTSPTCPKRSCTPTAGTTSGTSCTTPPPPTPPRRCTAIFRRGRSRARPPG